jgi:hypothetical protein
MRINMNKSQFTETQIVEILKATEAGIAMSDMLYAHGISGATLTKLALPLACAHQIACASEQRGSDL